MVVIVVVAVLVAVAASVLADRSRRAAEERALQAEDHMHAAQARLGALTVRVEELEGELAEARTELDTALGVETPAHLTGTDAETGLLGEAYFHITLERLVAAAKRHLRPVAVVLLEVADPSGQPMDVGPIGALLVKTLRDADIACRLDGHACFGVVLEDTPENGAVWSVERFRRAMAAGGGNGHILRAGIACYPAHAFDAGELRARAAEALDAARQWRQDRIEVATATEV